MKKISILLIIALAAVSCRQAEDTRYFAPEVNFAADSYTVTAGSGAVDIEVLLSKAAEQAFEIGLYVTSSLQENVQYSIPSNKISVAAGQQKASVHIDLVDDEIWDESSWIELQIAPGERYTVNPDGKCAARVNVTKDIVLPILRLAAAEETPEANPYLAETLQFTIVADRAPREDMDIELSFGEMAAGTDFLIDGNNALQVRLPAGATTAAFDLSLVKKDISGYDVTAPLAIVPHKGVYVTGSEGASVDVHLYDPVVNFKTLFRFGAQVGEGYQVRQAILAADGVTWSGNLAATVDVSAEGSAYLKNRRTMGDGTFGCMSNEVGLHILRLTEFFPKLRTTDGDAFLDYGNNNNTRGFSPVDSLFRFVLDKGSETQGRLMLESPRKFIAFTGPYSVWRDEWQKDSKATGGDIFASTNPAITGRVEVVLERLEGRFDMSSTTETMLFTAWFSCDSPLFMDGVDFESFGAVQEDNLWKVQYKLWPR